MDIKDFAKRFEDKDVSESVAKSVAEIIGTPSFKGLIEEQQRQLAQSLSSVIRVGDFGGLSKSVLASIGAVSLKHPAFTSLGDDFLKHQQRELERLRLQLLEVVRPVNFEHLRSQLLAAVRSPHLNLEQFTTPRFERAFLPAIPSAPFIVSEPTETATDQFVRRLQEHLDAAQADASDSGGRIIVNCKSPSGDTVAVRNVSVEDEHFVRVIGVDEFNVTHQWTGHHSSISIAIEVVCQDANTDETPDDEEVFLN